MADLAAPSSLPALRDPEDFPALYRATNNKSLQGQQEFLRLFRLRLFSLLIAAIGGAVAIPVFGIAVGAWLAFIAFVVALGAELLLASRKPERIWYEGRAAAESVKTLTWRFMVGGETFESTAPIGQAERELLRELKGILQDLNELDLSSSDASSSQISDQMRAIRLLPFNDRRDLYRWGRIDDQRKWYAKKALWNSTRASRWSGVVIGSEVAGVLLGGLVAFGALTFDALGILAAIAATVTAWVQAKQHQNLATAYSITSLELASVLSEIDLIEDESNWAKFVGQSEEAISREHTLWRASRGIRIKPGS
ncbi:DUF4231 domain-containing protein [Agreia sp. PsM10]|uniref:DUF4231 domain-containing protein n=1 Tax=Agreia sp. PsM10 TaxID=3030533 RepID=UPI00263B233D|nr:DUF4231 domain-containing protein [Agreia sp. PsM10]MDN4641785.1 DUF4231 domain-containing protein [Agreia sp. PsM10]